MNGRTARALRRAAGYKPGTDRVYEQVNRPVKVEITPGKEIDFDRIQIFNRNGSPRDMYIKAKMLFKSGQVKNLDTTSNSFYNTLKQVTELKS